MIARARRRAAIHAIAAAIAARATLAFRIPIGAPATLEPPHPLAPAEGESW
jgi:hypothetical protein